MVESKIISLQDDDDYVNILVYGDSGVGKTVLAGSDDRVLFVAPEDQGTLSAKRAGSSADKWPVKHWDDLYEAYEYFWELTDAGKEIPYNWIALDSLSELQDLAMRGILDEAVRQNPDRDPDIPALQDWQKYYNIVERLIKGFNSLPVNVIYTALARPALMPDSTEKLVPDLQGKKDQYAKKVSSWMTSFGHMSYKRVNTGTSDAPNYEDRRTITWRDTQYATGKDRTNALAPKTVNLTLKEIRKLIEEKNEQAHQPVRRRPKAQPETDGQSEQSEESEMIDA